MELAQRIGSACQRHLPILISAKAGRYITGLGCILLQTPWPGAFCSVKRLFRFPKSLHGNRIPAVENTRERAIEAFWILNDLVQDLICGTTAFEYFESPKFKAGATEQVLRGYNKMADSFIFVTLAKWIEFYDRYHPVIPVEQRDTCKQLRDELDKRGIREFRNKIVGHIWHRKRQRPLLVSEIKKLDARITKGDEKGFLLWINNPDNNHFGTTFVGTSEAVRDRIKTVWSLSDQELRASVSLVSKRVFTMRNT